MKWFVLICLLASNSLSAGDWIDKSEKVFFPPQFAETLTLYKSFPAFWWNFLVLEGKDPENTMRIAQTVCPLLKASKQFARVECEQDLTSLRPMLLEWAEDLVLRIPPPLDLQDKLNLTKSRLSLPLPDGLTELLLQDPLGSYEELQSMAEKNLRIQIPTSQGFFFDPSLNRILIPLQVAFPPSESDLLIPILEAIDKEKTDQTDSLFLGPHGSTLKNKEQISKDLKMVSAVGTAVLLGSFLFLFWVRRLRLGLIFIPVFLSSYLAFLTMIFVFGKVHGLTLAFGPGLVGLVIDYGLEALFNPNSKTVWKSNFMGFITTLVCLMVISFSQVPLLRELMIFSIAGFIYGYLLLFALRNVLNRYASCAPHPLSFSRNRIYQIAALVSVVLAFALPFVTAFKFDLRQFDYQDSRQNSIMEWIFKGSYQVPPLFEANPISEGALEDLHETKEWANKNNLALETVANYLPTYSVQDSNRKAWMRFGKMHVFSQEDQKLFPLFFQNISNQTLYDKPRLSPTLERGYTKHLINKSHTLSLWFPKNSDEAKEIQTRNENAKALSEITDLFPQILISEMRWMLPLSLAFIFIFLFIYYKNLWHASLGLFPFFSSVGIVLLGCWTGLFSLSFVTLVGLIMILGLSVDYAVFMIDRELGHESNTLGTTSGLVYAAMTTFLGFLPLLFCRHQVLYHLGSSLFYGTLGTCLGAFWGIPWLIRKR